jgi:hypothetical protein
MQFYSASTRGFYASEIQGDNMPPDAVHVTDDDYAALFAAQSTGKEIQPGPDGYPVAVDPPPSAPVIPTSISPAQARLALLGAGLLDQVEAAVAAGSRATQIAWEMATVIERSSPTVVALSAALGLTDAQLDDLFTTAAGIFV